MSLILEASSSTIHCGVVGDAVAVVADDTVVLNVDDVVEVVEIEFGVEAVIATGHNFNSREAVAVADAVVDDVKIVEDDFGEERGDPEMKIENEFSLYLYYSFRFCILCWNSGVSSSQKLLVSFFTLSFSFKSHTVANNSHINQMKHYTNEMK